MDAQADLSLLGACHLVGFIMLQLYFISGEEDETGNQIKRSSSMPEGLLNNGALNPTISYEPPCDKTNKMTGSPTKTQISLGIRPVRSESLLCAHWVAKDPIFLYADREDADQTGRMSFSYLQAGLQKTDFLPVQTDF